MKRMIVVALAVLALVLSGLACGETPTVSSGGGYQPPISTTHTVKIEVTGVSGFDVTYQDLSSDNTAQDANMGLPYWKQWTNVSDGAFVYISAQNDNESGSITCNVYVDGTLWKTTTSNGGYTICTASGILGN